MERSTSKARYHTQFKYCQFPKHEEGKKDGQQKKSGIWVFLNLRRFSVRGDIWHWKPTHSHQVWGGTTLISVGSLTLDWFWGDEREIRVARAKTFGQNVKSKFSAKIFSLKEVWGLTHWLFPPTVSLALLSETLPLEVQKEFSVLFQNCKARCNRKKMLKRI